MRATRKLSRLLVAALLLAATPASSAEQTDREREQLRRLQQIQRKLVQEKAQLAQDKAMLDGQLRETRDQLASTSRAADSAALRAATLDRELTGVVAQKEALSGKLAETARQLALTRAALVKAEAAGRQLDADLKQTTQALTACAANNEKLHGYGVELLDKYAKKGCGAALFQADPFTQLKRVEIENLVEDYREKLDEQKLDQAPR